jgi:DNA-binding CsgD family transcriptional regulator
VLKRGVLLAAYDARRPTRDIDQQARAIAGARADVLNLVREIAASTMDDGVGGSRLDHLAHDAHNPRAMAISASTVGRDSEIASINAFLGAPRSGLGSVVIEGEVGVGKTTLWQEAVDAAHARSYRVLACRPAEAETGIAFAGLLDLLGPVADEAVAQLPRPQRDALDTALLRRSADVAIEPGAVAVAVCGALSAVAQAGPVALAIDDLQWLDAPTSRALRFALRRLDVEPIVVVVTQRSGSAPYWLLDHPRTQRLRVMPLSLGATYQLIRARLGVALPRPVLVRVHETSGGNPLFALELARALTEREPDAGDGGHLPVPERLGDLLGARLARLTVRTRRLLLVAAAMGPVIVPQLRAVVGASTDADLEAAERAGILDSRGGAVRFTHPLLAAVVYDRATAAERRAIHSAIAARLVDSEERARHLALSACEPDTDIATALDEAATSAARRGATDAAARLAEQALALTPAPERAAALQRTMTAGSLALASGDRSHARTLFERAVAEAPAGSSRAEALVRLADVSHPLGNGLSVCDRALAETGTDAALRSHIHRTRGAIAYFLGDVPAAEEHARLSVDLAERSGDAKALGAALAELGHWTYCGGGGLRRDLFDRAIALDPSPGALAPRSHLAKVLMDNDSFDEARGLLQRLLATAMECGDLHAASTHLFHLAELELWAANWRVAVEHAEESLQLRQHTDQSSAPLYVKAMAQACLGLVDEARHQAEAARDEAERADDVVFRMQNLHVLGFVELTLGNREAALVYLGQATELLRPRWSNEFGDCHFVPDTIEALASAGDLVRADELTSWMEDVGRRTGRAWTLASAARSRALVSAAGNDLPTACVAIDDALRAHERLAMPFDLARTLLVHGVLRRRMKRRAAARESFEQSLAIFDRLGAPLWAAKARAEIARLGVRTEAQTELTPVEQRIAALVADGRTNREIAAALSLSQKTVEANLSRMYHKLGIKSRAGLVARVAELAVAGDRATS